MNLLKMFFPNNVYGEVIDIDVNGSSIYFVYKQTIIELHDWTEFPIGSLIVGDNINGNDGIGIIRQDIEMNIMVVEVLSGEFIEDNYVDNQAAFTIPITRIRQIDKIVKIKINNFKDDDIIGEFI